MENAKELVARYDGVLVIRAVINAPIILNEKDLEVQLVQNGNFVTPYHSDYLDGRYLDKAVNKPIVDVEVQKSWTGWKRSRKKQQHCKNSWMP